MKEHQSKTISHYSAIVKFKEHNRTAQVTIAVLPNYHGDNTLNPIFGIENAIDIEELKKDDNKHNFVVVQAAPNYVEELVD